MRALAPAIAGGGIGIVPLAIVEDAETVIISRPLGEHVGLVAVVAGVIAEQSDATGERTAIARADALRIAQRPARPGERVDKAVGGEIFVGAGAIDQRAKPERAAKALTAAADAIAVVAGVVDEHREAADRRPLGEVRRRMHIIAGEVMDDGNTAHRRAAATTRRAVNIVAGEIDLNDQVEQRHRAGPVVVVAGKIHNQRRTAGGNRRHVVAVPTADIDDDRRPRGVIIVLRPGDHHGARWR